jgi:hypothetical protein
MLVSRALLVVFKTTGGKRWIPRDGLPPLTRTQRRNRKKDVEQVNTVCAAMMRAGVAA